MPFKLMVKTTKNPRRSNNQTKVYRYNSNEVSEIAQCSVSYVRKVRAGLVNTDTPVAKRVLQIDKLLDDMCQHLLDEVRTTLTQIKDVNRKQFQNGELDSLIEYVRQFKEETSAIRAKNAE